MAGTTESGRGAGAGGGWAPWKWALHWQILLGLAIGALLGWAVGAGAVARLPEGADPAKAGVMASRDVAGTVPYLLLNLVGDMFLNGLKLIIVPLVTSAIILAVSQIASGAEFGRLGVRTLVYYLATSTVAILIGLVLVNAFKPGVTADGSGILVGRGLEAFSAEQAEVERRVGSKDGASFLDVFRELVPPNLVAAASADKLLGLIVVSLLVGFFISRVVEPSRGTLLSFTQGVYDVTLMITGVVLRLAPIGVIGLLGATVAFQYAKLVPDGRFADFALGIGKFALIAFVALLIHFVVSMSLILWSFRVNPLRHYRAMAPALVTAFSTSSSSATLPVTIQCVERRAGVSNKTASFVLPLGATVNMDGTALYECVAAMFICQAFGLELSFAQQFMVVVIALLTSIGVAGVPSASLVAIVVILTSVEGQLAAGTLPEGVSLVAGMGLLFLFDRPLDMCRTAVNIFSDSVGAVVVAKSRGEELVPAGEV